MGYTTTFEGRFELNHPLDDKTYEFFRKLNETRRMKRNLGPEYGVDGEWFVNGGGWMGQGPDASIVDYNEPPATQPGLWCKWRPTKDRCAFAWDGGEKFYDYVEWLRYIIGILAKLGYALTGEVHWYGEDRTDTGTITVKDNVVTVDSDEMSGGRG